MAERRRIIEGTWTCAECGTEGIAGRAKRCPSCGAAREDGEASFDFGAQDESGRALADAVEDADGLDLAQAGVDWYCFYCQAANRGDGDQCAACGSARHEAAPKSSGDQLPPPPPPAKPKSKRWMWVLGLLLMALLAFGIWAMSTEQTDGEVEALSWSRTLTVERFTEVSKKGWRTDLREKRPIMPIKGEGAVPGVFDIRGCVTREREPERCSTRTIEEPCGTKEVCEVRDQGNGFAEEICRDVPKTCPREVEECTPAVIDDQCTYSTHVWSPQETRTANGTTEPPRWPESPELGPHDRTITEATYDVTVRYAQGERHTFNVDPSAFSRWAIGQPAVVTVNNLGQVVDVERKH